MIRSLLFVLAFSITSGIFSQESSRYVIGTSGGSDTVDMYILDWTIGETVTETFTDPFCILSQGFHQTLFKVTKIPELSNPLQGIRVYPNPTTGLLNIDTKEVSTGSSIQLGIKSIEGKLLYQETLEHRDIVQVHLQTYEEGIMILQVIDKSSGAASSFKIIKINQ